MNELRTLDLRKLNLAYDGKRAGALTRLATMMYRAKVPGGWLVVACGGHGLSGVAFYPDPTYKWDGGSLE